MRITVTERPLRVRTGRSRAERRVTYALKIVLLIVLGATIVSAILDFVGRIRSVTIVVVGAIFFTYAIYPVVRRLNARLPLGVSILIVYAAIAAIVGFGMAVIVPALVNDTHALIHAYPAFATTTQRYLEDPNNPIVRRLPDSARNYLATLPAQFAVLFQRYGSEAASRTLAVLLSTFSVVATVVVIPVISAYLMLEAEGIKRGFVGAIPPRARKETLGIIADLDRVLGGFIRGQFLVGAIVGTCIGVMLLLMHVKYAVLIAVLAGLLDIIPYVGAAVGFVPSVLIALVNDGWVHAAIVGALFIVIFQLEGHFIAPNIVSESVGLSPLTVIIAILVGAELLGVVGMFIAVPVAAALRVFILHALPRPASVAEARPGLTRQPRDDVEGPPGRRPRGAQS